MTWKKYELDDTILKATEDVRLWQAEKGILEISKNTLATAILLSGERKGYVFHGQGKLLIDAIAETDEGAIGKSIEKKLNDPFLMLGDTEEIQKCLTKASEEDFQKIGYESQKGFLDRAEDFCHQFFEKRRVNSHQSFDEGYGLMFAFQNENSKFDILVAKGSKLVYKAMDIVFVSNENKVVLKSPREVVCAGSGKSVIIKR